jgi:uncharacterized protein involved in outer membrane biogenesis
MDVTEHKPIRWGRILAFSLIGIALLVALALGGAWYIARTELRPFIEQRLSRMLDRQMTIGTLDVTWSNPLRVEMSDLHLANAAWGSTPDMGSVKSVSAVIDVKPLFSGKLRFLKLVISGPVLVLERDTKGNGNWRFKDAGSGTEKSGTEKTGTEKTETQPAKSDGGPSFDDGAKNVVPSGRDQFPVLLDFTLQDGKVSYRTFSGHVLKIDLDQVQIKTTGDDQPVELDATGAYNGTKLAMAAHLQSFDDLHDNTKPFGTAVTITHQSAKVTFDGTMMDPINADGARGKLTVDADKLSDLLAVFGDKLSADPPAALQGHLTRAGDIWHLGEASGKLAGNPLTGQVTLHEGSRGESDDIDLAVAFKQLNLGPLLSDKSKKPTGGDDWTKQSLQTPDKTAPRLTAKLSADQVKYQDLTFGAVDLSARIAPGEISLAPSTITYAGVPVHVTGALKPADEGGRLDAQVTAKDADAATIMKSLGSTTNDLSGKISAGITLSLTGKTVGQGLKAGTGGAVLSMTNGRVSRDVLEKASTDLRNVFRKGEGTAQVTCLLGVMRLKSGIGVVDPLRLRTSQAVINGKGKVDFLHQTLDLTLRSDRKSTDFLALDIPIHLSGAWQNPSVDLKKTPPQPSPPAAKLDDLSAVLRDIAAGNACHQ